MNNTKNIIVAVLFAFAVAFLGAGQALATVSITTASGGGSISADTAANAASPAWTTLGNIIITEGANGDFGTGTNTTLILKAPSGFQFNTAVTPSISFTANRNISSAAVAMTDASTITITLTVTNNNASDALTIGASPGIQVQPTAGRPVASGNITVSTSSTENVTGITRGTTSLGALTEVVGAATKLAFGVQPGTTTAGSSISPAVTVIIQDQFGNTVTGNSSSVTIASSTTAFTGSTLTAAASSGVATFSAIKPTTAGGANTLTASDGALTGATSNPFTVNPAAANKLVIVTPPSSTATAGIPFAQQPVIWIEDTYNNLRTSDTLTVTAARSGGAGTLQGTTAIAAAGGVATFTDLEHPLVSTITIQFTSGALTSATSTSVAVSAGAFSKLQLLMPGETAAAGTTTGKTGTPSARTAGTAFTVTVNAVDDNWNLINAVTDTVDISSSDATAALPADAALVAGTQTFSITLKDAGTQTVTATDVTDGSKTANTSPSTTVNAGTFTKLQLLMPGELAAPGTTNGKSGTPDARTAGTAFTVTVNAVDANWNLVSSTHTVGITTTDPNDTNPANATLTAGTRTFSVTFKTAGSWTVTATDITDGTKTANTSPSTTANPGAFAKLQLLVPGETAAPGTATGKTGTPSAQTVGTLVNVTVNAVDANWNPVNTASDTVDITSSDANASLPPDAALSGGTGSFTLVFQTAGSRTVTATDLTDGSKTPNTSPNITVGVGAFVKLQLLMPGETASAGSMTGKTGSPNTQTAGASFTVTVNAVDASWNLVNTITHTAGITSSDSAATLPANAALVAGTKTYSVTAKTAGAQTFTATDLTDGTKTPNTSPAATIRNAAATKLVIATQPSATAVAGVAFDQQPVIYIEDTYNNICVTNSTVTATRNAGAGSLLGATNIVAVDGVATYTDLAHTLATNITIKFTSGSLTAATSSVVTVNSGTFSQLLVVAPGETYAPGSVTGKSGTPTAQTAGTAFTVKVIAVDSGFNTITAVTDTVGITSSDTTAVLPGNAALVNGTNSFTITCKDAGSQTITASDITDGLTTGTSTAITVNAGTFTKLQLLMPGETAAPGTPTGKTGTSDAQTAGTAFTVTVNGVDANWNVVPGASGTSYTIHLVSSDSNSTMPANADLASGTRTFSVTLKTAGSVTITASDADDGSKTPSTSPATTVNVGAFAKLQLLMPGETAAPGTATGHTGTPSAQNTDNLLTVTVNAVDANWNLVNTVGDTVGLTSSDPSAALAASAALSAGTGTFSVKFNTAGSRTVTATDLSDGTKTANTGTATTVAVGAFAQLQILLPGETAAAGTTTGKTGSPTARIAGTAFNVTVNAVDASHNLVSTNDSVHLTSSDANAGLPVNTAMASGTVSLSVTLKTVGSWTVTASDVTHALIGSDTSTAVSANVGAFAKLQVLVPGETAAPGSVSGKTGTPSIETAGTGYSVTVNAVDANWNVVSTNDTVGITTTDANDILPANAALAAGTKTFSLTNKTAGSWTLTASDITHTSITANTSPSITVTAGAFTKLQLLMPGETASAGTTAGKTGTPSARSAGTAFNVTVNAVDDNWNLVNSETDTIDINSTDANATLPTDTALVGGTQSFSVTLRTVGTATVTATDVTDGSKTANTSPTTTVNAGALARLQLLLPGEAAAPGTTTGKTGTPNSETAGASYSVTVRAVDAAWNLVSTNDTVAITSTDPNATLPASAALSSGTRTFSLTNKTAGTWTVTASDTTHAGVTANISPAFTVNPGAFTKLQILVPGLIAAPGTTTGFTGTTNAQNTENLVTGITVNAVDANWNLVSTVSDSIGITCSDPNAALPPSAGLVNGTQNYAIKFNTAGSRTITATDLSDGTKTPNTSPAITVTAGAFARLQILLPGESAAAGTTTGKSGGPTARTAGTAFNVTVNAVDASYNLVSTNDTVTITSSDNNATLPANNTLSSGTRSFSVTLKTGGNQTVTATDVTHALVAADTSSTVAVNAGALAKLQLLVPGETAAPGTTSGKTGTPTTQTAGTSYSVTVNAVDANWNLVSTNDTISITSTDPNDILPANAALVAGTQAFSLTNRTAGSWTVTASDVTHTGITANTSPSITVVPGAFTKLQLLMPGETASAGTTTGKTGTPSARTAGTAFNVTVNAVDDNWNLVAGVSDTAGITSSDANAVLPGSAALGSGTGAFSVTFHIAGSQTVTATDATDGSKTANTSPATSVNSGPLDHYAVTASSPNNAGVPFTTTVTAQDSFNNPVTTNTATVTLTATGNVQFDSNGDDVYGDNTKALTSGVLTIATKDNFAETVNITATANSKTGTLTGLVITPAVGAYESVATGDWSDPATWNTYDGSSWVAATVPPASTNAPTITIQSGNTVTVTTSVTAGGLIVQSTGQITVASGQTLTIPNGTGTDLDVAGTVSVLGTLAINSAADVQIEAGGSLQDSGTVNVSGTLTASTGASVVVNTNSILQSSGTVTSTASTLAFNSGGTYQHAYTTTAGTIPTATWNTNSTCAIVGYTSNTSAPGGLGQTFGHFTWNCPSQSGTIDLGGALTTVKGDLAITRTGSSTLRLSGNLTVGGSFSMSSGTFDMTSGFLGSVTLNVGGDFSHTGGTITVSGFLGTGNIVFNKAGAQTYTSGGTVNNSVNFTVNNGSTLVMGTSIITGGGSFTLSSGAGLQIGSPAGITTSGATGNIRVTGTRTFNTGANYTYNGTAAQATGNGLPATVNSLTISNSAGVTLSASTTVNGALTLTNGVLITGANQVNLAAVGSVVGANSTSYVNGTVQKAFNTGAGQSFTYPIGDAVNYLPLGLTSLNVTTAGTLAAKTTPGEHPNIATSGIDAARSVNRYWTLTTGGSFAATDLATFNYLAADVDGAATPAQFVVRRYSAGAWQTITVSATPTITETVVGGAIASGDLAIGNQAIHHYAVSAATPQTANTPFITTVTAEDAINQPVTSDSSTVVTMSASTGTVQFDSNGDSTFGDNTQTLSAGTFTISTRDTAGETITLTATDANARTGTSASIVVNKIAQTVSFGTLAGKTYGNAPFDVSATASSGLPVGFSILSGPATIAGNTVTITGAGTVTVRASQAGNATYGAAPEVDQPFTVAQAELTVTANNRGKTYGQEITFAGTEFTPNGLIGSDSVTSVSLNSDGAAATAAVSGSPYAIVPSSATGSGLANYAISYVNGSLTVAQAPLTVTGITADSKPFDGTTTATIHTDSAAPVGVMSGDDVTLNTAGATGAFADASPGTGKTVYISGLTISGASIGNYSLTQPTTTADITGGGLTVAGIEASSRAYDGTTNATLILTNAILVGVTNGDDVSLDTTNAVGAFEDKNIGTAKTVKITGLALFGADAGKYALTQPSTNADITPIALSVTGVTANSKPYDGNTTATLAGPAALSAGVAGSEDVTLGGTPVAAFDNQNVGTAKPVTVSGYALAGADIGNYTLSQPAGLSADITPASSATSLVSAQNPSAQGSNVTFTATVSSGAGTPTGEVVFKANTVPFSTNSLVSGIASASTTALAVGTNTVTAEYAAQGNYLGSTNSLEQVVAAANIETPSTLGIQDNGDGTVTVTFAGTPGAEYVVQAVTDLGAPSWQNVSTNTAAANGQWTFTDSTVGQPVRFYRSAKP